MSYNRLVTLIGGCLLLLGVLLWYIKTPVIELIDSEGEVYKIIFFRPISIGCFIYSIIALLSIVIRYLVLSLKQVIFKRKGEKVKHESFRNTSKS